jgi:lysophospholipase L1-like esterase
LIQIALVIVLGIAALELALQAGALAVRLAQREQPASWLTGRHRVLALGDSNTYGLYVQPEQAYPKVFESLWNADSARRPIEVLNLGFPGTNSSWIRRDLPRMLRVFRPDVVTVMVGANDYWTAPVEAEESEGASARLERSLWKYSRLYRLLYMARRSLGTPTLRVTTNSAQGLARGSGTAEYGQSRFELGWTIGSAARESVRSPVQLSQRLEANLSEIAEQVRESGGTLVLLTYPSDSLLYGDANAVIREVAAKTATPLVDLRARFGLLCADPACSEYFFRDQHPTAAGHAFAARTLAEELAEAGLI